jgi:hypothetical protein
MDRRTALVLEGHDVAIVREPRTLHGNAQRPQHRSYAASVGHDSLNGSSLASCKRRGCPPPRAFELCLQLERLAREGPAASPVSLDLPIKRVLGMENPLAFLFLL